MTHTSKTSADMQQVSAIAHQWQVRRMNEWFSRPIGHHVQPGDFTHRVICAIQVIRNQVPAYSLTRLANEADIPRSTLTRKLNGTSEITVNDICRLALAMDVGPTDILELAEKGSVEGQLPTMTDEGIPPGFTPLDEVVGTYQGKRMDGQRWTVISEWDSGTKDFSLTFWAHDDRSMTAAETNEYAAALVEMTAYITRLAADVPAETEAAA